MANHIIRYQYDQDIGLTTTGEKWLADLYNSMWELRLEVQAFILKLFHYVNEVFPILLAADIIDMAFGIVEWVGLSSQDEEEVKQWLLKTFSTI